MKLDKIFDILIEDMVSEAMSKEEVAKKIEEWKKSQAEKKAAADRSYMEKNAAKAEANYKKNIAKIEHDEKMKADDHTQAKRLYENVSRELVKTLIEFINVCSGVGLHGDEKPENEVSQEIAKDPETGKEIITTDKVTGEKTRFTKGKDISKSDFDLAKKRVINAADKYTNSLKDADNRLATYFKYKKEINKEQFRYIQKQGEDIKKAVNKVHYDQLTFDELEKDMNGVDRYNADIFNDLYTWVVTLTKRGGTVDMVKDQLGSFKGNEEERAKKMENAIFAGNDAYERARNSERLAGNIENARIARREETKENKATGENKSKATADYKSAWYQGKMLTAGDNSKKMVAKGVAKINTKKATEIVDKWIAENAPKDKEHTMKLYGSINGRSELGVLVFMPVKPEGNCVEFEGLYAYKVPLAFTKGIIYSTVPAVQNTTAGKRAKYVEDMRKDSAWKKRVNEKIGEILNSDVIKDDLSEYSFFNY